MNKLTNWLYGTFIGGLYFEFLLWLDRRKEKPVKFLSPKEISQIIRESNKLADGVNLVKSRVNDLVSTKSKESYHQIMCEIEDLTRLASHVPDSPEAKMAKLMRDIYVKKRDRDIVSQTDMALMIDQRINDHKELWQDQEKRKLLRDIRKAANAGDKDLVNKLQAEFGLKYGRSRSNTRLK